MMIRRIPQQIPASRVLVILAAIAATGTTSGAQPPWLTGRDLDQQLNSVASVAWSNTPLSRALASLRSAQHIAIVLDRRIDPDREIQLDLPREPLADILRKTAQQSRLGYCQFGPVAYFGPPDTARKLRTLAAVRTAEAQSLPSPAGRKLLARQSSHWDQLAEPRKILEAWASEAGVKLKGAGMISHDLWPAAELPPMSWIERVTILTAQFGHTFRIDHGGRQIELVPIPANVTLAREYRVASSAEVAAKRWASEWPDAIIEAANGRVRVEAPLEDHEAIAQKLRGAPARRAAVAGKEVYQVAIENAPLARVSDQLAQRLGLSFTWDGPAIDKAGISLDQLISVRVENADVDALLQAMFKGTGLTFERTDRAVQVRPDAKPD